MFLSDAPALNTTLAPMEGPSSIYLPPIQVDFGDGYGVQTVQATTINSPLSTPYLTPSMFNTYTAPPAPSSLPLTPLTPSFPAPVSVTPQPPTAPVINKLVAAPSSAPVVATSPQTAPSTASPQSSDWFTRNVVPLVQAGLTTYAAVNQYNAVQAQAASRLPAGVSPSYLPTSTAATGPLSAAQLASLTPAQQQQYYAMYPSSNPALYPSTGGLLQSMGLGSMDTTTMLLLGGGSLLLLLMLSGGKKGRR